MNTIRKYRVAFIVGIAALVIVGVFVGFSATKHPAPSAPVATASPSGSTTLPPGAIAVRCNDNPATDAATLQEAIDTHYGGTLYIAAGTCEMSSALTVRKPEVIDGAGQNVTFLVQGTGVPGMNVRATASPFAIENVSLDAAADNPGTYNRTPGCSDHKGVALTVQPGAFFSVAHDTTIRNVTVKVSCVFGVRITAPNPCTADMQSGTVVSNLNVSNIPAGGGFGSLGIDCTNGATLSDITVYGNILALYYDKNVTLTGETYFHGLSSCQQPFSVSAPSSSIVINGVGPGIFQTANGAANVDDAVINDQYNTACPPINGP